MKRLAALAKGVVFAGAACATAVPFPQDGARFPAVPPAAAVPAAPAPSNAELWGYVDGAGVAHMAGTQVDSRYTLVLGEEPPSAGRVPGKSDGTAKMLTWLDIAPEVKSVQYLLREASRQTGVDSELLKAVIAVESGFDARAVSPRGAVGLMQLMPDAAERYLRHDARQPASRSLLDARTNILAGARMLADLTRRFGRIDLALAAWNAGEGAVRKAGGRMPPIEETRAHVQMVLELYWALLQRSLPAKAEELKIHAASAPR